MQHVLDFASPYEDNEGREQRGNKLVVHPTPRKSHGHTISFAQGMGYDTYQTRTHP